jgi:hypothetical protein
MKHLFQAVFVSNRKLSFERYAFSIYDDNMNVA